MSKRVNKYPLLQVLSSPLCAMFVQYPFCYVSSLFSWNSGSSYQYRDLRQHQDEIHGWQLYIFTPGFTKCSVWSHTLSFTLYINSLLSLVTQKQQYKAGEVRCDLYIAPPVLSFRLLVSCEQIWKSSYTVFCNELKEGTTVLNVSDVEMFMK